MEAKIFNNIYFLRKLEWEDEEIYNLSDSTKDIQNKLAEYNSNWFSVHKTINTFIWDRRIKENLREIKACFIDIDYPEIKQISLNENNKRLEYLKNKFESEIKPKIEFIHNKYEIYPGNINITYKGFHIYYPYTPDCYFIEVTRHEKINSFLINFFWGDTNAKDVSREAKMVWFIDRKGWVKCITEALEIEKIQGQITKIIIKNEFKIVFKERNKNLIIEKWKIKIENKNNTYKKVEIINQIDSKKFIEKVKEYFESILEKKDYSLFREEKLIKILNKLKCKDWASGNLFEENGIDITSWLKLKEGINKYTINDYSKKNRSWNYNFLKNWVLGEISDKIKFKIINQILFNGFGLSLNFNTDRKTLIDSKIYFDFLKQPININTPWYCKVFIWLFCYLYKNIITKNTLEYSKEKGYTITFNDFLREAFDLNTKIQRKYYKNKIKEILKEILKFKISFDWISKNILDIKFINPKWRWNTEKMIIKPLQNRIFKFGQSPSFINYNILKMDKWFSKSPEIFLFLQIDNFFNNWNYKYTINFQKLSEFLWIEKKERKIQEKYIKTILKKGRTNGIFKDFIIENTVIISKYKIK